jgi:O-acetylhomoserine (thiol)-lyase
VHDLGPSLSPFNAFQLLQGIETLDLRMDRHSASALQVARALQQHPLVSRVHHPGLDGSPWHDLAERYLPGGASGLFSFDLVSTGDRQGDWERVERVVDALRLVSLVANIGDARSLVAHPASMTHSHLSDAQFAEAHITRTTIRLSVGLENPDEIIADLFAALDAAVVVEPAREPALEGAS